MEKEIYNDQDGSQAVFVPELEQPRTATTGTTPSAPRRAIRHVEKRRTSTCAFANRIAETALEVYRRKVKNTNDDDGGEKNSSPTCIAAILVHDAETDDLTVVALGVGTKFLTQRVLQKEQDYERPYGRRVRDLHAEVLCRRAFRRYLSEWILQDVKHHTTNATTSTGIHSDAQSTSSFLERCPVKNHSTSSHVPSFVYKLRNSCTLHAYFSSTPCGNATIKKFAKMSKEVYRADLKETAWPMEPHTKQPGHSIHLGQFALLLKRDATTAVKTEATSCNDNDSASQQNDASAAAPSASPNNHRFWKDYGELAAENIPTGTTLVRQESSNGGSLHTCSDKVCRWNCLGWQGSLLASLLDEPLHMQSITVGRKYSRLCFQRAVCCRIAADCGATCNSGGDGKRCHGNQRPKRPSTASSFTDVHHPATMGTSVYVDPDAAIVPVNNKKQDQPGTNDMKFTMTRGYCWWPNSSSTTTTTGSDDTQNEHDDGDDGNIHVINGHTGFALMVDHNKRSALPGSDHQEAGGQESPVSTHQLTQIFQTIHREMSNRYNVEDDGNLQNRQTDVNSLCDLRRFKQTVSPCYETRKAQLFQHKVMKYWRRRCPNDGLSGLLSSSKDSI